MIFNQPTMSVTEYLGFRPSSRNVRFIEYRPSSNSFVIDDSKDSKVGLVQRVHALGVSTSVIEDEGTCQQAQYQQFQQILVEPEQILGY